MQPQAETPMLTSSASRRTVAADFALSLWLAVVYFLLARTGMLLSVQGAHASVVSLPAGLALAALLIGGPRLILGVALGALAARLSAGSSITAALAIAL